MTRRRQCLCSGLQHGENALVMKTARIKVLLCMLTSVSGCASTPPLAQAAPEQLCSKAQITSEEATKLASSECYFIVSDLGIAGDSEDNLHRLIIPFVPGYQEKRIRERLMRDRARCLEAAASAPK